MARNLQSKKFIEQRRKKLWWALALSAIIVITGGVSIGSFMHLQALQISEVTVFGADQDIADQIRQAAESALAGNYLGMFPRSNILVYPKAAIIQAVKASSLRVLDVKVARDGWHGITVTVNEKAPGAAVCDVLPDFDGNILVYDQPNSCYLADSTGLIFDASPAFTGHMYDVYYAPDLSSDVAASSSAPVGLYATSTAEFSALQTFYEGAKSADIAPDGVLIKDGGEYEMYASTTVIYFNDQAGLEDELADLVAFWAHAIAQAKDAKPTAAAAPSFDYIDLRYGSNVFYK